MIDIILVHTGTVFESYINDCITQLKKFNLKIHLILSDCLFDKVEHKDVILVKAEDYLDDYYNNFNLIGHDNSFRDGFWIRTSTRFFLINSYARNNNVQSFFHIENDNLIFNDLNNIKQFLQSQSYDMALVVDSEQRCIPSVIWFRDSTITKRLSEHIYNNNSVNDMTNLYNFFISNRDIVTNLPIIPSYVEQTKLISTTGINYSGEINYSNFYEELQCVFDGAAIGQYIGGIDTRNNPRETEGFVNETTIFDVSKFNFFWKNTKPYFGDELIPIVNLHLHSKNLKKFLNYGLYTR
jgi:hypothetical protein